jgi:hypothetical protein
MKVPPGLFLIAALTAIPIYALGCTPMAEQARSLGPK